MAFIWKEKRDTEHVVNKAKGRQVQKGKLKEIQVAISPAYQKEVSWMKLENQNQEVILEREISRPELRV